MSFESGKNSHPHESFNDPEIKRIIAEVNFESLKNIFNDYAERSGVDLDEVDLIEPSLIKKSTSLATVGSFQMTTKELYLSERGLQMGFRLDPENDKVARILSALIHEETHAFGGRSHSQHEEDMLAGLIKSRWETTRSGFAEVSFSSEKFIDPREKFRWFNEGFVDELGAEVYGKYIQREGVGPTDPEKNMDYAEMYPLARLFVRSLRDRIAEESGVPEEVVWQSLIKSYVEGDGLLEEGVQEALDDIFSDKFIQRIASIGSSLSSPVDTLRVFSEVLNKEKVKKIIGSLSEVLSQKFEEMTRLR